LSVEHPLRGLEVLFPNDEHLAFGTTGFHDCLGTLLVSGPPRSWIGWALPDHLGDGTEPGCPYLVVKPGGFRRELYMDHPRPSWSRTNWDHLIQNRSVSPNAARSLASTSWMAWLVGDASRRS